MRFLVAAVLLAASPIAAAQPALTDSSDTYVTPIFGIASFGSVGTSYLVGLDAGRRLPSGLDVGFRALGGDVTYGEAGSYLEVGPQVGLTRRLPAGLEADVRAVATASFADLGPSTQAEGFGLRVVRGAAQTTLSRPFRLVGSLKLAPTVGAYGTACATVGFESLRQNAQCAEAGAIVGLDVRFRVLGADVSLPVVVGLPLIGNDHAGRLGTFGVPSAPITGGLRVQF